RERAPDDRLREAILLCAARWIASSPHPQSSSPGLTGRSRADSTGRRNNLCMGHSEEFVESFRRCFPADGFSGPGVERNGHGLKVIGIVCAEIGALWKVLAQQPVGILVGAALPWAVRIAEVDLHARVDL